MEKFLSFKRCSRSGFAFCASLVFLWISHDADAGAKKAPVPSPSSAGGLGEKIWVKKNDGSIACSEPKGGEPLALGRRALENAGVKVFDGRKQNDGQMRATVCGIPQGNENAFEILRRDREKAEALGFSVDSPR